MASLDVSSCHFSNSFTNKLSMEGLIAAMFYILLFAPSVKELQTTCGLWGMYKRSEPIKSLHSVQNHMANVYSSKVCLQTKIFPKFLSFFFSKNTPKYDKLSKISNISIKTILELWTKFGNFGNFENFGHISDRLRTIHNTCSNLIGSEPLYILPTGGLCPLSIYQ